MLLLDNLLVKFLSAPEPFRHKDALGSILGFFKYLFVGSFDDPEWGGELFVSEAQFNQEQEFYYELLLLLLDLNPALGEVSLFWLSMKVLYMCRAVNPH